MNCLRLIVHEYIDRGVVYVGCYRCNSLVIYVYDKFVSDVVR